MTYGLNRKNPLEWLAVPLATALLCSGCVASQLAPTVVDYNRAVEQAQNQMLLLNAVRAAKRQPLYLTDTTKITGSIKRDLTATLTFPFGILHHNSMTPGTTNSAAPGGTYSVNPTFDVNVLNAQEFMQKFTAPMDPAIFAFYWNEGWPQDMLLHLFVSAVEVQKADGKDKKGNPKFKTYAQYFNHPRVDDPSDLQPAAAGKADLQCFSMWVRWLISNIPRLTAKDAADAKIGPLLGTTASNLTFTDLIAGTQKGYTVEEDPELKVKPQADRFQLKRTAKEYRLEFDPKNLFDLAVCGELKEAKPSIDLPDAIDTTVQAVIVKPPGSSEEKPVDYRAVLHLRSHEALVYYLGQIVRLERNLSEVPLIAIQIGTNPLKAQPNAKPRGPYELVPLFVAFPPSGADLNDRPFPDCHQFAVQVADAEAETYGIPRLSSSALLPPGGGYPSAPRPQCKTPIDCSPENNGDLYLGRLSCDAGESMHVLSLLTQLIALEKTAKETQSTPVVRTVGQ